MAKVRKRIYFSGRVQGVGFRWRAMHWCDANALTGWVKNLYDGRVEMEVQGEERSIYHMITELGQSRYILIEDCEIRDLALIEDERSFRVR